MAKDLFGQAIPDPPPAERGKLTPREWRKLHPRKQTKARGYARPPGTGPAGETCGSCKHIYRKRMSKTYIKRKLTRASWTGGTGSDIRVRAPACEKWEKPDDPEGA